LHISPSFGGQEIDHHFQLENLFLATRYWKFGNYALEILWLGARIWQQQITFATSHWQFGK
jgi:hypothetical protein